MRKTEHQHSTPEQVADYLEDTLMILNEGAVPDDLRQVAFVQIFQQVASKQIFFEQVGMATDLSGLGRDR